MAITFFFNFPSFLVFLNTYNMLPVACCYYCKRCKVCRICRKKNPAFAVSVSRLESTKQIHVNRQHKTTSTQTHCPRLQKQLEALLSLGQLIINLNAWFVTMSCRAVECLQQKCIVILRGVHPESKDKPNEFFGRVYWTHESPEMYIVLFKNDESTEVEGLAILIVFVRYPYLDSRGLTFKPLATTASGTEIYQFWTANSILWDNCFDMSRDEVTMTGNMPGAIAKTKEKAKGCSSWQCILHRHGHAVQKMPPFTKVVNETVKIINFIKSRPKNNRLFKILIWYDGTAVKKSHMMIQ